MAKATEDDLVGRPPGTDCVMSDHALAPAVDDGPAPTATPCVCIVPDPRWSPGDLRTIVRVAEHTCRIHATVDEAVTALMPSAPGCIVVGDVGQHAVALRSAENLHATRCLGMVLLSPARRHVSCTLPFIYSGLSQADNLGALIAKAIRDDRCNREWAWRKDDLVRSIEGLTHRELHVLQMLLAGYTVKDVALCMGISHKTAHNHRHSILKKTRFDNFIQLLFCATAAGMVDPASYSTCAVRLSSPSGLMRRSDDA